MANPGTAPSLEQLKSAVPEQPRLAPGVKPAGQMGESAFVDPPWLLERDGQGYVQVPRPLYRIAEEADGRHTLDEIARDVAQSEGRGVSAENVRQLLATQFIPKGLVPTSDGTIVPQPPSARSALAIARMKTIDPQLLSGITRALQVLHWTPVLIAILAAGALAQGWLYFVHGVGASLHDAFYVPGFMLLVFTVIILSAGFHELGHATALRYAGGKPRSFGFGMYLMYPAFFTDVSDNYRLPRWARVRTDLGGFYFNLIFALGIFALYVLTRQEVLLVIIVLMNFEIVHQLLPFLRLDGYWTLADVTGIPDFFSRMGAFLRSILPLKRDGSERTLPPLKWWGKAVFLGYILVTIPALAVLSFLMVRSVPRVLATAWDALGQQGQVFVGPQANVNVLAMAGAAGQSLLILLPVAGLIFSLYRISTGIGAFLWRWSAGSTVRRSLVALVGVAFAALVYFLWAPQIPFLGNRPSPMYQPDAFQPIGREERFSLGDALSGAVTVRTADAELPAWLPGAGGPAAGGQGGVPGAGGPAAGGQGGVPGAGGPSVGGGAAQSGASVGGGAAQSGSSAAGGAGGATTAGTGAGGGANTTAATNGDAPRSDGQAPGAATAGAAEVVSGVQNSLGSQAASVPPAATAIPALSNAVPALATAVPGASNAIPAVSNAVPAVSNAVPGVNTVVPSLATPVAGVSNPGAAVATAVPAVATAVPGVGNAGAAVATAVPGVNTVVPALATAVPGASSTVQAVATAVPGAGTAVSVVTTAIPATATALPGAVATQVPDVATALPTALPTPASVVETAVPTLSAAAETAVPTPPATLDTAIPTLPALVETAVPTLPAAVNAPLSGATPVPTAAPAPVAGATPLPAPVATPLAAVATSLPAAVATSLPAAGGTPSTSIATAVPVAVP